MIRCGEILPSMPNIFASQSVSLTRSLTLVMPLSRALRASVVAKPVKIDILPVISLVLAS